MIPPLPPSARQKFQTVGDVYLVTVAEHWGGGVNESNLSNKLGVTLTTRETFVCVALIQLQDINHNQVRWTGSSGIYYTIRIPMFNL